MNRNLFDLVERHEGVALIHHGREITYADLRHAATGLAGQLHRHGIREGDVVSLLLPNSPAFVVAYLACWYTGAIANPLNSRLSTLDLTDVVTHAGGRLIITGDTFGPVADTLAENCDASGGRTENRPVEVLRMPVEHAITGDPLPGHSATPPRCGGGQAPAVLIYTSGTTSAPKGVLLSHNNLLADSTGIAERLGVGADYRTVCFMPLFHCNALIFSHLSTFVVGGSVVLLTRFSASSLLDDVESAAAHSFSCPPTVLAMLLERTDHERPAPHSLQFVKVGAAPLAGSLAASFEARFGISLIEGYGMTEGTATSVMHDPRLPRPDGTVGSCLAGQHIRIVDAAGQPLPTSSIGEIQISGATVMLGYHRDPALTEATVVEGWLHTGDLGHLDEHGYLRLAGRKKELIIRGGENIFPAALDEALQAHPHVAEGAVFGVPDPIWGESPVAAIVAKNALDLTELREFMRGRVADYAMPVEFHLVEQIPRNAVGKVQRHELARLYQAQGVDTEPTSATA